MKQPNKLQNFTSSENVFSKPNPFKMLKIVMFHVFYGAILQMLPKYAWIIFFSLRPKKVGSHAGNDLSAIQCIKNLFYILLLSSTSWDFNPIQKGCGEQCCHLDEICWKIECLSSILLAFYAYLVIWRFFHDKKIGKSVSHLKNNI